jgi:hypothetical protein
VLRRTLWGGSQGTLAPCAGLYTRTRELTPTTRAHRAIFLAHADFIRLGVLQFDVAQERGEQSLRMPEDREAAAAPVVLTVARASSRGGALARV